MKCPHCGNEINIGALLGSAKSRAKTKAARLNAKLGGWPKGKKRGKRKPDANQIAHGVVAKAEKLTRQIEKAARRVTSRGALTHDAVVGFYAARATSSAVKSSTKSESSQTRSLRPAAIAGVIRNELWMRQKL